MEQTQQICLVNLVHLNPSHNGGVQRIVKPVSQLLADYAQRHQLQVIFAVGWRFAREFPSWLGYPDAPTLPCSPETGLTPLLLTLKPSIVVSPLFGLAPFNPLEHYLGVPYITAIPDTLALDKPELFSLEELQQRREVYSQLHHATVIVTISEYSKQRLIHHLQLSPEQIVIIPPAGNHLTQIEAVSIPQPYVLYPANGWLHKRHDLLMQIMQKIWKVRPELNLVLTGYHQPDWLATLTSSYPGSEHRIINLGYVSDNQLTSLYREAEALLFVSEYEGFGLPLLEAMENKCPVICAPLAAIPEVAGDAALYVDSVNPSVWADALLNKLPLQRSELVEKGLLRSRQFSWEQSRQRWIKVLTSAGLKLFDSEQDLTLSLTSVTQELIIWANLHDRQYQELEAKEEIIQNQNKAILEQQRELAEKKAVLQFIKKIPCLEKFILWMYFCGKSILK